MEPAFLTLDEIIAIHRDQLSRYGGGEGIHDLGLLQSALAQPRMTFGGRFLHEDLFGMAAAYLFHIVQNHPFVDGNKRVGAVAALVVLELNGIEINASEGEFERLVRRVAEGEIEKPAIADFLRAHATSV